jgi:tetratricopeptide (TPR) repeat protein
MIRFIGALFLLFGTALSAQADVFEILKAGLAARSRGDFDRAIYYYTQAIAAGELNSSIVATVLNSRGVAYEVKGENDKAIADFDEAIRLKPGYGEAYINRGLAWAKRGDFDRAIADFTQVTALEPRLAYLALSNRGIAYGEKRDYTRAIQELNQAVRLRPDYASAYYNRANIYNAIGDRDKALADFDVTIRIRPDFQAAYINRGAIHVARGDSDKAIVDFDVAIRLNPRDALAFGNRAYAYFSRKEYDRAVADLNEAIRFDPYSAPMYFKRGLARLYAGPIDPAIQDFATAVRLQPTDAYAVIWLHVARGRAHQDSMPELVQNATRLDGTKWPAPLVDLHLGSMSHDVVSGSAGATGNSEMQRNQACDVQFYLATFDLEQGKRDEADQHLHAAVDLCTPAKIERVAAEAELDGISARH